MILQSEIKSPLRYAGGKSRGIKDICKYISPDIKELCSPFFGGGSVEIACAQNNIKVHGYDNFRPLVEFWQCLLDDPHRLVNIVRKYHPLARAKFYELQRTQNSFKTKWERAAVYYVINRSSFSGTTLSGGMSPNHPRFTPSSIERLANFKVNGITVKVADFKDSIRRHKNTFLYLDPPYLTDQKLYGHNGSMHEGFDHKHLAGMLQEHKKWILSYNDSNEIRSLYNGFVFMTPSWKYGMSSNKNSREVIILSHEVAEINGIKLSETNRRW
jgi:DNA adenine methylase